ncbi:hypothetical protein INT82_15210 [Mannheimia haemolytica]|nr:hypothetical protein [Mannheimia haemolytica]
MLDEQEAVKNATLSKHKHRFERLEFHKLNLLQKFVIGKVDKNTKQKAVFASRNLDV